MMAQRPSDLHRVSIVREKKVERDLVAVIDDDDSVRESLPDLLREFGYAVEAFASAEEFLEEDHVDRMKCLILDVALRGMSGPDLQLELQRRGREIPIIYITAQTDETVGPRMLARGALAYLRKPFSEKTLLDALAAARGAG